MFSYYHAFETSMSILFKSAKRFTGSPKRGFSLFDILIDTKNNNNNEKSAKKFIIVNANVS